MGILLFDKIIAQVNRLQFKGLGIDLHLNWSKNITFDGVIVNLIII